MQKMSSEDTNADMSIVWRGTAESEKTVRKIGNIVSIGCELGFEIMILLSFLFIGISPKIMSMINIK